MLQASRCHARSRQACMLQLSARPRVHPIRPLLPLLTASTSLDVAPTLTATEYRPVSVEDPRQQAPTQQEQQHKQQSGSFSWTKQWWPVIPVAYLEPQKPYPVTLLGLTYVVWFDPKAEQWRVMEDRCPHRLAPLSEGRIDERSGNLMCSYHGWEFNGSGACTKIPQVGDPEKMAAACASPRACVTSYPTTVVDGLLFVWLEAGPAAEQEAAAKPPYNMPELAGVAGWHMTVSPTDYRFWLEQGMDPSHANFLHHNCGFPMTDAVAMPGEPLTSEDIDLTNGYTWTHGNYSKKNAGMTAIRQFVAPNSLRVVYDKGPVKGFGTMGVPVRPGVSRVFARFAFKQPGSLSPLMKLLSKLPHWTRVGQTPLADQDTVINSKQEVYMNAHGHSSKDYAPFARADQGVMAAHKWFDMAGYENMWKQRLGPDYGSSSGSHNGTSNAGVSNGSNGNIEGTTGRVKYAYQGYTAPKSESLYFNWYERHTKHCADCQKGMKLLEQAVDTLKVMSVLLVVLAASLAVAAKTVVAPGVVVSGLLAAACLWVKQQVWDRRQVAFIDSTFRWQKTGGLSLVQGDPIRLY